MKVLWSPQAKQDYWNNINYLESKWTHADVLNFINKVDAVILLLQKDNIEFVRTHYKKVCKVVITKHISLFYTIQDNTLSLLRFWNNYQDLKKLKL